MITNVSRTSFRTILKQWVLTIMRRKRTKSQTYRNEDGIVISKRLHTWTEIKQQIERKHLFLGRDIPTAKRYHARMKEIASEWRSINDYCKHTYLKRAYATKQNLDGSVTKYVTDDVINHESKPKLLMARNDFPYHLSQEIHHFVLWSSEEREWTVYEEYTKNMFPAEEYEMLMFENSIEQKSVKSVMHVHVFVRSREKNT